MFWYLIIKTPELETLIDNEKIKELLSRIL